MLLKDFFAHVATLIKPAASIRSTITDKRVALVHAALGVAGEVFEIGELVAANPSSGTMPKQDLIKELGDLFFYIVDLATIVGHTPESFEAAFGQEVAPYNNDTAAFFDLCKVGDLVTDYTKKVFAYNDEAREAQLSDLLDGAFRIVTRVCQHYTVYYGLPTGGILIENYDKLKDRYPKGYSDAAAAERADTKPAVVEAPAESVNTAKAKPASEI